jgi:hypothetical protein
VRTECRETEETSEFKNKEDSKKETSCDVQKWSGDQRSNSKQSNSHGMPSIARPIDDEEFKLVESRKSESSRNFHGVLGKRSSLKK